MISVVLPCFKSKDKVLDVLQRIDDSVSEIIVVDDCCPEHTGKFVQENFKDSRCKIIFLKENLGVGGAMKAGYKLALQGNATIVVKMDSDGQMPPEMLTRLIEPIVSGYADYCKGNRFYDLETLNRMPIGRLVGNSVLSFLTKLSTGYWSVMDPTNGYLAIHRKVLENIPINKLQNSFLFETDLLFRANTIGAMVKDVPMQSFYGDEQSNLSIRKSILPFFFMNITLYGKRIFYNYFLRDFGIASVNLVLGVFLFFGGLIYGAVQHLEYSALNVATPTGIQVITAILMLLGFQLLLNFIGYDMYNTPKQSIHKILPSRNQGNPVENREE